MNGTTVKIRNKTTVGRRKMYPISRCLKNRLRLHGFIVCMSDNADKLNYPNFNIEEEDINSVWYAEWYFSAKIPNIQETYYRKQAELEDRMDELTKRFDQFQTALNMSNR